VNPRARGIGIASDTVVLLGAFLLAGFVRLGDDVGSYELLLPKAALCVAVLQLSLYYGELYDYRARRRLELFLKLGQCVAAGTVALAVVFFAVPSLVVGRGIFGLFVPFALLALLGWRLLAAWTWGAADLGERVLVLGTGVSAQKVGRAMLKQSPLGYRVLGFLTEHREEVGRPLVNPGVVGMLDELPRLVREHNANLIVVAQEDRRRRLPMEALLRCRLDGVRVVEAASIFESLNGQIPLSDLRPSWLVFSSGFSKPRLLRSVKRIGEVALVGFALALAAPVMALVALAVKLTSPGPVLYRQTRVGEGGREFPLLKFRTMRADAESASGPVWATAGHDPRVTPVGRVLRKTRLDELPQLWNVLRGDMSFVGPRPERPHFVEKLRRVIPYYDERHAVRPGITGWAQVKFSYGSTLEDAEEKLEYDLYYVKHMSLLLDVAIVLETAKVMLLGRGR
jgi:sugar transferase (PEP-CTERM system associated)